MREPGGDPEQPGSLVAEFDRDMLEVGWRLRAEVERHVEHSTTGHPDQLALGGLAGLQVEAADRASAR